MIRIDKQALDYLLSSAAAIGFDAVSIKTRESIDDAPRVHIHFRQTRVPYTPESVNTEAVEQVPVAISTDPQTLDDDPTTP